MGDAKKLSRRTLLASSTTAVTAGGLLAKSTAARTTTRKDIPEFGFGEAIEIEDGEATVSKGATQKLEVTAQRSEKGETQTSTYTARDLVDDVNRGVRDGLWEVRRRKDRVRLKLTHKGKQRFDRIKKRMNRVQTGGTFGLGWGGCGGINKFGKDKTYLADDPTSEIVWGLYGVSGTFEVASAIVTATGVATISPAVLAIAGVLVGLGATYIALVNNGSGIVVDKDENDIRAQESPWYC